MDKRNVTVLLDNGHGRETPGKRSPDGRLMEWEYTRRLAAAVEARLLAQGIDARRIVEEDTDVPINERVQRVNAICDKIGTANVILVSIHINAAVGSGWKDARGWTVWVAPNASGNSKRLAKCLYGEADKAGYKGNRWVPDTRYWIGNYGILRDTKCQAVLTENLFQNNKEDVAILMSEEGEQAMVDIHVKGIADYIRGL